MGPASYFKQPPRRRGRRLAVSSPRPSRPRRHLLRRTVVWGLWLAAIGTVSFAGLVFWYSRGLPDPNHLIDRSVAQTTKLYDRTGQTVLYEIHGDQKRTIVPLDQIPKIVQQATLVAEDRDFYQHAGISLRGILRAAFSHATGIGRGGGGSTLTQQLVKNAILTNEKLLSRKLKELILAWRIERSFSKDQILQLYLNEIPYGGTNYGIQSAAQSYFGKNVGELTLAEATTLAAISNAPTALSPYTTPGLERLTARQRYILDSMVGLGYISAEEAAAAKEQKLTFVPRRDVIIAPHFSLWVYEQLVERYGRRLVEEGGLKVITTLDADFQKEAEAAVEAQRATNQDRYQATNAALVAIDVPTGQIKSLVGSADFFDDAIDGQVNVALSPRQPGSSFKPTAYAAAFNAGYSPRTVLFDVETDFPTEQSPYHPHNYDLKEHGPVTMRQALAGSLNIPAVKTLYLAGIDQVLSLAQRLGYTSLNDRSRFGLSLVLGGGEVSLLEHVNAYATFAREGNYLPIESILKVESSDGRVLEEWQPPREDQVLRPEVARTITDVLSDNGARAFIFGAANHLTMPNRPVAAKTGTTNDYHDAWTLGYTPQLAVGVWVGNSNNDAMKRGADGSVVAAPIWQKFMVAVHRNVPVTSFTKPPADFNYSQKPMLNGTWENNAIVAYDTRTNTVATPATPPEFIEERSYPQVHTILQWVNRNDPLGAAPQDPQQDSAYSAWEKEVARWREQRGIINQTPPDTLPPAPEAATPIVISAPGAGESITADTFTVIAQVAGSGSGVTQWRFSLDGQSLGTSAEGSYAVTLSPLVANGLHAVSVTALNADGFAYTAHQTVNIDRVEAARTRWQLPPQIGRSTPLTLRTSIEGVAVKQVDFYLKPPVGVTRWLGVSSQVQENGEWTLLWPGALTPGTYIFSLSITTDRDVVLNGGSQILVITQ